MTCRWLALVLVVACGPAPERGGGTLTRLGFPKRFAHCTVDGESRPATACVTPVLLATHKGRRIPPTGLLRVRLDALPDDVAGNAIVQVEAFTYANGPRGELVRHWLRRLRDVLPNARRYGALAAGLGGEPAFERAAQAVRSGAPVPRAVDLALPPRHAGRRVVYAVWAWPPGPVGAELPIPGQLTDASLSLAVAVHEVARDGLPPVTFEAELVESASDRSVASLWRVTLDPAANPADRGWRETTVDLARWGQGPWRLRLRADGVGAGLGTWARPIVRSTRLGEPPRSNVLLLSLDTLRADHVGAYGYARATTPRLDALAAQSVVFEHAYAPFPSTTASHMSMLTALMPCAHGVTYPTVQLAPGIPTLAEVLAARGYATAGITEDGLIAGEIGFDRGFDRYRDLHPNEPGGAFHTGIALARRWIESRGHEPFFLFLHTYQVHPPYKIPPHLRSLFTAPDGVPDWEHQKAGYDAGLRHTDELLAGFLDFLEARDVLDRTVLVVTSDHGIEFGERGHIGHARGVHVEQLRVPLLVRYPPLAPRRVPDVVGVVDVTPTVLELAAAPSLRSVAGRSLVRLLRGEPLEPRATIGEQLWGPRQTALRDGAHTWITTAAGTAVFDVRDDPWERRDRAAEEPELAARGHERIAEFRRLCAERRGRLKTPKAPTVPAAIDPERARALKALGYVQ